MKIKEILPSVYNSYGVASGWGVAEVDCDLLMSDPSVEGIRQMSPLRLAVIGLVLIAILTIVCISWLSYAKRPAPEAMIGVPSLAVGALATLLGSTITNGK